MLSDEELIKLKRLSPHGLVGLEQVLSEVVVKGLTGLGETEPESEDKNDVEGTDEGVRGS